MRICNALKGHNKWYRLFSINSHTHCYALSGHYILALSTVGVAHGYYILPFQGVITWHCLPMACHRLLYYTLSWHHHLVLPTDSVALIRQCQETMP